MARRKPQGHYCKICGERKSNESFSGKGHAAHICKACSRLSPQQQAEQMTLNKFSELPMRYLSNAEVKWLKNRTSDPRPEVRKLAELLKWTVHTLEIFCWEQDFRDSFGLEMDEPEPVTWRVHVEYSNGKSRTRSPQAAFLTGWKNFCFPFQNFSNRRITCTVMC